MSEPMTVTVVTTQVQSTYGPTPLWVGDKAWSTNTCSFMDDCSICLCVCCLAPCYICQMSSNLGENCCAPICVGSVPLRQKIRMMRGIRGSLCDDWLMLCCPCTSPCTLCQMAREMKHAGWL